MNKNYLFVCGCPRSGTTAMLDLLNYHPSIALGVERYKFYAHENNLNKFNKSLFDRENFLNITDDQTNLNRNHPSWQVKWSKIYRNIEQKYASQESLIVGDKYPYYYRFYENFDRKFNNTKWIFMLRDINEVAQSYNARAANKDDTFWNQNKGYQKAVTEWNESLAATWHYLKKNQQNILVCQYEKIFSGDQKYLRQIQNFLDLPYSEFMETAYHAMTKDWHSRLVNRSKNQLDLEQQEYIRDRAKIKLRDEMTRIYCN